jgi:hypothetical protein
LEGVAVNVVVDVLDQAVPVTDCVAVTEDVIVLLAERLGVPVIVVDEVIRADGVPERVPVAEREAVLDPEAVTVGVPVAIADTVEEEEGVPESV